MKPTIGRIVRFEQLDGEWPAIITRVHDAESAFAPVDLQVFEARRVVAYLDVPYLSPQTASDGGKGRGHTWHWPELAPPELAPQDPPVREPALAPKRGLFSYDFLKKLQEAGLIGPGVQRVVIDCKHDEFAVMYLQHAVNEKVLDVLVDTLAEAQVRLHVKVVDETQPAEDVAADDIPF